MLDGKGVAYVHGQDLADLFAENDKFASIIDRKTFDDNRLEANYRLVTLMLALIGKTPP